MKRTHLILIISLMLNFSLQGTGFCGMGIFARKHTPPAPVVQKKTQKNSLVLAGEYFYRGDWEESIRQYKEILVTSPEISSFALFRIAQAYRRNGDDINALIYIEKSLNNSPPGWFKDEIILEKSNLLTNMNKRAEALMTLKKLIKIQKKYSRKARTLYHIASVQESTRDYVRTLFKIIERYPMTRVAALAAKDIIKIKKKKKLTLGGLSVSSRMKLAKVLMRGYDYNDARIILEEIPSKKNKSIMPGVYHQIGMCFFRSRRYKRSAMVFRKVINRYPGYKNLPKIYFYLGISYARYKNWDKSLKVYDIFKKKFPKHYLRDDVEWRIILTRFYGGMTDDIVPRLKKFIKKYRGNPYTISALQLLYRIQEKNGDLDLARKSLKQLLNKSRKKRNVHQYAAYWYAGMLTGVEEKNNYYWKIVTDEPFGFYGMKSFAHLKKNGGKSYSEKSLIKAESYLEKGDINKAVKTLQRNVSTRGIFPHEEPVLNLLKKSFNEINTFRDITRWQGFAGLYDFGKNDLLPAEKEFVPKNVKLFIKMGEYRWAGAALSVLSPEDKRLRMFKDFLISYLKEKQGDYRESFLKKEIWKKNLLRDYTLYTLPTNILREYYPRYYWTLVKKYATRYHVDPYLVLSVMREESRFQSDAVSRTGAVGLMQIMPETGERIKNSLRLRGRLNLLLLDPEINIRMGCWYLSSLLQVNDDNILRSLASYNGGQNNVDEWWGRTLKKNEDYFLKEISFEETRKYVKKVLKSYQYYRMVYANESDN